MGAIAAFKKETEPFSTAKGTIRFPSEKPLLFDLIKTIVAFRLEEIRQLAAVKAAQKRKPAAKRIAGLNLL